MALYLGIPSNNGIDWGYFPWFDIVRYLQEWLSTCCGLRRPVRVLTVNKRQQMSPWDGLVYLVGDGTNSVITRAGAPESQDFHVGSTSNFRGEMISEVYMNASNDAFGLAATVYHELLHNKLWPLGKDYIHRQPGNFTSAAAPYTRGGPSEIDQKLMCVALTAPAKQFQGGF